MKKPPGKVGGAVGKDDLEKTQAKSTPAPSPAQVIPSAPSPWQAIGNVILGRVIPRVPEGRNILAALTATDGGSGR